MPNSELDREYENTEFDYSNIDYFGPKGIVSGTFRLGEDGKVHMRMFYYYGAAIGDSWDELEPGDDYHGLTYEELARHKEGAIVKPFKEVTLKLLVGEEWERIKRESPIRRNDDA